MTQQGLYLFLIRSPEFRLQEFRTCIFSPTELAVNEQFSQANFCCEGEWPEKY